MEPNTVSLKELSALMNDLLDQRMDKLKSEMKEMVPTTPGASADDAIKGVEKEIAFFKALVKNDETALKDLSEGTDSAGGYVVPTEFYGRVIEKQKHLINMRRLVNVVPMKRDKMDVPTEGNDVTVYWPGENTAATASDISFGNPQLEAELVVALTKASRQLLEDADLDVLDYLARIFARALSKEEDRVILTGSGSGQPQGIRNASISASFSQAGATFTYDELVDLMMALPAAYRENRENLAFVTSTSGVKRLMKIKDADSMPVFIQKPDERGFRTVFGIPVIETAHIPSNLGAGTDETELWFGDWSYYNLGDRNDFATEYSTQAGDAFAKHQGWLKGYKRIAGKVAISEAFVYADAVV